MSTADQIADRGPLYVSPPGVDMPPWSFQRLPSGSVRIIGSDGNDEMTLPPAQWASVVTTVSWAGDTPDRYEKAYRFHHGDHPGGTIRGDVGVEATI